MATHIASTDARPTLVRFLPRAVLSVVTATGLVIDAVIHLQFAADRDSIGGTLSEGNLFRIESAAALLAAVLVLVLPWRRTAYAVAFVIAASAFGAVMLYRYVDVGALGPIPNMYEPVWFHNKTVSAVAEAVAAFFAAGGFVLASFRRRTA
ncbi:MAG TPA: hypothetical protein VFJ98_08455 [Mycobacteriales bacterium]|nr:hypothetical protein [Mycobacteriales bacterium]